MLARIGGIPQAESRCCYRPCQTHKRPPSIFCRRHLCPCCRTALASLHRPSRRDITLVRSDQRNVAMSACVSPDDWTFGHRFDNGSELRVRPQRRHGEPVLPTNFRL